MDELIHTSQTTYELEQHIASVMIDEFRRPGLILLPVGQTFESRIYPLVNNHFGLNEYEVNNELKASQHLIHPQLKISHLDELVDNDKTRFSKRLQDSLSNVMEQIGKNFFAIDIDNVDSFNQVLSSGPRVIFLGLGSDPNNAHIAFIGEEFINSTTAIVNLSDSVSKEFNCKQGLTIGTDIFHHPALEQIIVVVIGENKAKSLETALQDPDTGLGYLITNHKNKLKIFADNSAIKRLS